MIVKGDVEVQRWPSIHALCDTSPAAGVTLDYGGFAY
jgi:hypothetical protein